MLLSCDQAGTVVVKTAATPQDIAGIEGILLGAPVASATLSRFELATYMKPPAYVKNDWTTIAGVATIRSYSVYIESGRVARITTVYLPDTEGREGDGKTIGTAILRSLRAEYDSKLISRTADKDSIRVTVKDKDGDSITLYAGLGNTTITVAR